MASKNDFRSFDWDDTALIKAYNKGTKLREKGYQKTKNPKKDNPSKENVKAEDQWKVGDYCRAEYSVDRFMYEAKICSIKDGCCTVEFLGYGDKETVDLTGLLESAGKKARRRQNKTALGGYSTASDSCLDTTDGDTETRRSYSAMKNLPRNENQVNRAPFDYSAAENSFYVPHHTHTAASHPHIAAGHSHPAANHPHAAACYAPPAVLSNMPFMPAPPAPPMPQCPSVAQNPALSAMLVSWYMAGYYTGLHQGPKSSQCPCCSRANRCCH